MAKRETTRSQRLDALAGLLRGVPADRLRDLLEKDARINIRLTAADLAGMKKTAKALQITVTEYVLRMHYIVSRRLNSSTQKEKK